MTASTNVPQDGEIAVTNDWADFWFYKIGANVIPADTKNKNTSTTWAQWQGTSIPEEQYLQWKTMKAFGKGIAIIAGKLWRGSHRDKYLIFIDCDNQKAIDEVCTLSTNKVPLQKM